MNYKISHRAASLSPSMTLAIDAKAKQMKADGQDVVGFGAGEPDFDTPQHIKDAASAALAAGFTKYTPSSGIPELRQAVVDKFKRDQGLDYKPSQIIVSCGGKHSCFNVILATCQEGDEVIIPAPYWLSYPEMVKLAGATPVLLTTTDRTEFKVTPEQLRAAITPRTRLFVLNSPSNPTGSVYTPGEIKALGDICVEHGVLIMSDEIYEKLVYDGCSHFSVATISRAHLEHTIIVHGLAKAYSMTGWRLGYLAAPEPIAKAIDAIQSHSTSNPTSFAQKGGVAALTGSLRPLFRGIERADSVALDPHKWLYTPHSGGVIVVRDMQSLADAFAIEPSYVHDDKVLTGRGLDLFALGPQFSRGFHALKIWVSLLAHGWGAYERRIAHDVALARYLHQCAAAHPELETMGPAPALSIACFRYVPRELRGDRSADPYLDRLNERLMSELQLGGRVFPSNAIIHGRFALRACIVNFRTEAGDIDALVEQAVALGSAIHHGETGGAATSVS